MALAVYQGQIPPLRLGFSAFVNGNLVQDYKDHYCAVFRDCEIQMSGGEPLQILQKINQRSLDCAILAMPIDDDRYCVQQVSRSPMVVCMRAEDPLASEPDLELRQVAERIKIFRDPELHPAGHSRLVEMFREQGFSLQIGCSANTPSHIQWMVKAGYGLALIDQLTPLEPGLTTRPITDVNWTVDTAFVYQKSNDHIALPFIERSLAQRWKESTRKKRVASVVISRSKKLSA